MYNVTIDQLSQIRLELIKEIKLVNPSMYVHDGSINGVFNDGVEWQLDYSIALHNDKIPEAGFNVIFWDIYQLINGLKCPVTTDDDDGNWLK